MVLQEVCCEVCCEPGRAQKGNLPFYLLLQLLHEEARIVTIQLRLVKASKRQRYQRKKYRKAQGRIQELWDDFKEGKKTPGQLLKACSYVYAPHLD